MSPNPATVVRRWKNRPPTWSPARERAIADLREWERQRQAWSEARAGALHVAQLVARAERGTARPLALPHCATLELLPQVGRTALALLGWLAAAQAGWRAPAVVGRHVDWARLLACCERTAGTAMRRLVRAGVVERRPGFQRVAIGHVQLACTYALTPRYRVFLGLDENLPAVRDPRVNPGPDKTRTLSGEGVAQHGGRSHGPVRPGLAQELGRMRNEFAHAVAREAAKQAKGWRAELAAARQALTRARERERPPAPAAGAGGGCPGHGGRLAPWGACLECDELRAAAAREGSS